MIYVILGLLPSLIWLAFFLKEDIHPEPRRMIFLAFILGMAMAFLALGFQYSFQYVISGTNLNFLKGDTPYVTLIFAAIEEIFKFLPVYFIIRRTKYFDETLDAAIYLITAALGLAAVENFSIIIGSMASEARIGILTFRFLGATFLHALSAAVIGLWWAKGIIKKRAFSFIIFGLALATALHALFNYIIIIFKGEVGVIYSIVFLVAVAFLVLYGFEKSKTEDAKIQP